MRLARIHVQGYRCLEDITLDFRELTVLLGSNSAGKSSLLRALGFFFHADAISADDVFAGSRDAGVSVQAVFEHLTPGDREVFGTYAQGDQMVLRRTWQDGAVKMSGQGLRYDGFEPVRALSGVQRRAAFRALSEAQPDLGLPEVRRVDEADAAMLRWEMEHPERCATSDQDAGHLFGYASVGQRKLGDRFKFVFVPGLQDASEQALERRGTILERLLTAIADQRAEADGKLVALEERLRADYAALVETSHRPTLEGLARNLAEQMQRYLPTAAIRLDPIAQDLRIAPPLVQLRGGEAQSLTDLGRQGHGFQRTFIIAALEYLAAAQDTDDSDRPCLFLAIEEPELYQHPPRAVHFANTLRDLALADGSSVQVCYATHSPYFVSASEFASVRIFRRPARPDGISSTTVTAASESTVKARLSVEEHKNFRVRLVRTLRTGFREAFFARAVLLVEGDTDVAVFSQTASMLGTDLWSHGVVPVPVPKSIVPLAYAILESLEIPTYVFFDGDKRETAKARCEACGRGGPDAQNDILQNRRILEVLQEPQQDFPLTQVNERWGCYERDLESYLGEECDGFDAVASQIARELGWKRKSPEVYAEAVERLGVDRLPRMLVDVPKAALALAEG